MPTYSYRCTECGTAFDIQQSFTDDSLTVCPNCGGKLRKLFSAVGVSFTGSGFYRNDSRAAENKRAEKKDAAPAAKETAAASSGGASSSPASGTTASGTTASGTTASKPAPASTSTAAPTKKD